MRTVFTSIRDAWYLFRGGRHDLTPLQRYPASRGITWSKGPLSMRGSIICDLASKAGPAGNHWGDWRVSTPSPID
jgi:hypothetical protein